ncbi:MAG TPA: ATP-binding cassette domain-containing protein [Acidimicrobiia bacterium]|nr:ATP-binding cassette domain-containing protein [Acidimicrobiia bacterium]
MAALLELDDPVRGRLVVGGGETVVLLGPSGAGKTRLIRALLGLDDSGPEAVLSVRGRRARPRDLAALVGWVPEGDGVFLSDSVWDNVARPPGVPPNDIALACDALDLVGLGHRAREPVANLPRPGRRRVALARAVASRRPLLIVDGPLDPAVWALLPGLLEQAPGVEAVLLATATAGERAWQADSVALVAGERIVAQAPLAELMDSADPEVRSVLSWVSPS